ncbi:M23 family metallopeptidase [Candidatus Woesearchaeota archaeon]|nr:M23 family metallopeptidase [Candidatus Woesearchaeota archaeon]
MKVKRNANARMLALLSIMSIIAVLAVAGQEGKSFEEEFSEQAKEFFQVNLEILTGANLNTESPCSSGQCILKTGKATVDLKSFTNFDGKIQVLPDGAIKIIPANKKGKYIKAEGKIVYTSDENFQGKVTEIYGVQFERPAEVRYWNIKAGGVIDIREPATIVAVEPGTSIAIASEHLVTLPEGTMEGKVTAYDGKKRRGFVFYTDGQLRIIGSRTIFRSDKVEILTRKKPVSLDQQELALLYENRIMPTQQQAGAEEGKAPEEIPEEAQAREEEVQMLQPETGARSPATMQAQLSEEQQKLGERYVKLKQLTDLQRKINTLYFRNKGWVPALDPLAQERDALKRDLGITGGIATFNRQLHSAQQNLAALGRNVQSVWGDNYEATVQNGNVKIVLQHGKFDVFQIGEETRVYAQGDGKVIAGYQLTIQDTDEQGTRVTVPGRSLLNDRAKGRTRVNAGAMQVKVGPQTVDDDGENLNIQYPLEAGTTKQGSVTITDMRQYFSAAPASLEAIPLIPLSSMVKQGRITSGYRPRRDPISGQRVFHHAWDVGAPMGEGVKAISNGVVRAVTYDSISGHRAVIEYDNGFTFTTAHHQKVLVKKGDRVNAGDVYATVGRTGRTTGPHVHLEVEYEGKRINPKRVLTTRG